jgi:NAD(P)-dependent dehydrogenase (short-subunit alcohol dehydrogenase family)
MLMRLKNKIAIVTGGGSGIGKAIAFSFAREGASVCAAGRTLETVCNTVNEIINEGGKAIAVRCDISNLKDIEVMINKTVEKFNHIDILVNNAAIAEFAPFLDTSEDVLDKHYSINIKGTFFCAQFAARIMIKQGRGGRIINISSISDVKGDTDIVHYCVTKGGIRMMTRSMALELAKYKITVNSISPGTVITNLTKQWLSDPDVYRSELAHTPIGRLGQPEDIVGAALYLASGDSSWTTGTTIYVDGGFLA